MKLVLDFTPLEARQFFGLPDVQPLQAAAMAKIEERIMAEAARFSAEGLLKSWVSGNAQGADWVRDALGTFLSSSNQRNKSNDAS